MSISKSVHIAHSFFCVHGGTLCHICQINKNCCIERRVSLRTKTPRELIVVGVDTIEDGEQQVKHS